MRDVMAGFLAAASLPALAAAQTTPTLPQPAPNAPVATPDQTTTAETAAGAAAAPAQHPAQPVRGGSAAQARRAAAAAATDADDEPDVIVTGQRNLPGAVIGDIPPEQQLGPADIRSYGVSSVSDLLDELAPQIRSDRGSGGAPVVLLNGRRISGFQEVRDLPTEAIARVDILPEEVALKYGYAADQKVVNIVLRRRFRAATVEATDKLPTEGGQNTPNGSIDLLNIRGQGRFNVHTTYTQSSALTESERDITQTPSLYSTTGNVVALPGGVLDPRLGTATLAGAPLSAATGAATLGQFTPGVQTTTDMAPYRTLLPKSRTLNTNLVYATTIFGKVGATINGELALSDSTGLYGLPTASFTLPAGNPYSPFANTVTVDRALPGLGVLTQNTSSVTGHLGTTFNGNLGDWRWSLTGTFDRAHSETFTDTGPDVSAFQARLNANDPTANPFAGLTPTDLPGLNASVAKSTSTSGGADALFNGDLFDLPAGSVSTSVRVGASSSDLSSTSYRAGLFSGADITRTTENGQVNIDVPLTSRSKDVLPFIGTLSINGNVAAYHLSDFGTLTTRGFGANWSPRDGIRVLASHTDQGDAPSAAQLGNPVIVTPNVRVFDYIAGTTATVTTVSGGNPGLVADSRHTTKVELNLKPFKEKDLTFVANYIETSTDNAIAAFPTPTAEIEQAFPGRFTRDGGGNLIRLDSRPINYARTERSELRYGFNLSISLKSKLQKQFEAYRAGKGPNPLTPAEIQALRAQFQRARQQRDGRAGPPGGPPPPGGDGAPPPPSGDGATPQTGSASTTGGQPAVGATGTGQPDTPPPGGFGGGGRGFGGGGFGGRGGGGGGFGGRGGGGFGGRNQQGGGRLQFALYHTWHFTDRVLVSANGPALDLLHGDAIGQSGGQPRHELEGQAGYLNNGLGVRFSVNYQSGTTVNGGNTGSTTVLDFSSLTTVAMRVFADPSSRLDLIAKHPWLRGMRATLSVDNLFDSRQRVTDQTGATPISYQPDYLNPLGRTIRLSIRKLFF